MDTEEYWQLVERARAGVPAPGDVEAVADRMTAELAAGPPARILAAQQAFWDLMAASYRAPLWAAAYLVNGGCSDDGFEYFRGWLITQGRDVFDRAVADPDTLADLPAVREAARTLDELECEATLGVAWDAHLKATGSELPPKSFTISYPALDPDWGFDFDDRAEISRRLPRLAALYQD